MKSKDTHTKPSLTSPPIEAFVVPAEANLEFIGEFNKADKTAMTANHQSAPMMVIAKIANQESSATFQAVQLPFLDLTFPLKPPGFTPSIIAKRLWSFTEPSNDDIRIVWQAYKANFIDSRTTPNSHAVFLPDGAIWFSFINVLGGAYFGVSNLKVSVALTSDRPFSYSINFNNKKSTHTVHAVKSGNSTYIAQRSWVIRAGSEDITVKWAVGPSAENLSEPLVTLSNFEISRISIGF